MPEIRYNPLLNTYTMVAANRQKRPNMPKDFCPFCPGSGKVPNVYDVWVYPNDFPTLSLDYEVVDKEMNDELYESKVAKGVCEVILYSSNHTQSLYQLSLQHISKLIETWKTQCELHSQKSEIKYVFPFENRGEEVGVTMPHPHGQLYAYPFVPAKLEIELNNCAQYFEKYKKNMFDSILQSEQKTNERLVYENAHFYCCIPHFTDYPFGVFVIAKSQKLHHISMFDVAAISDLAKAIKYITTSFELVYNKPFPYMMCVHQTPVNEARYENAALYYRFHIEFYPPLRSENAIKWYAGSEMGAGAAANTMFVEDTAKTLREIICSISIE
jgi:UDPglucose--hexose-1-phosphate uridylyltransferase